jgi:glycerol-3-phosphate O-acyltransferase
MSSTQKHPGLTDAPKTAQGDNSVEQQDDATVTEALLAEARGATEATPPRQVTLDESYWKGNPSGMVKRPALFIRLLWRFLFRRVAFDERHVQTIRDCSRQGDLVFVMNHHSTLDYSYFNYSFLRLALPLVFFANNISMAVFRPAWRIVLSKLGRFFRTQPPLPAEQDVLAWGLERAKPALIFLKRRGWWPWSTDQNANSLLETILRAQLERIEACAEKQDMRPRAILVIPQLLVWSQNPNRYRRTLRDMVFGNPETPGRLRKAISFILNRRRAFVQVGRPINLMTFIENRDSSIEPPELAIALRFEIFQTLSVEEKVIKGPILKDAKRIRQEILRTPEMQNEIRRIAATRGLASEHVEKKVARYLKEMAADFSMGYVEGMCMALTLAFDRLYSEVVPDLEGLERVREAGRKAPLILLPCHRSHVDYLVISYLFYVNGLIPPHIAAGQNLNFFPLGHIFRRSGAFFIRRSFKGNEIYQTAFREYLRKLVREGYWIEFFPEGGRSRSGKMLPPKFGLLSTVLDSVAKGAAPDAYLVPIYVGYEQVIEERSYTEELTGESEKKRENITGLLKTTKVLWSRYGRLYVSFAEPISIRQSMKDAGLGEEPLTHPDYPVFVRRMGYRILDGIQTVALVTPSAVTAMALLIHPKRGIRKDALLDRIGFLLDVASLKEAPLSKTLAHALKIHRADVAEAVENAKVDGKRPHPLARGEAGVIAQTRGQVVKEVIEEVLQRYVNEQHLNEEHFEDQVIYVPVPAKRINLDFYKNNIVHLLVAEAVLAAAIRSCRAEGPVNMTMLKDVARFLSSTFKYEFVYDPSLSFDEEFERTITTFLDAGLLIAPNDDTSGILHINPDGQAEATLQLLHHILEPWLESYWLMAVGIDELLDHAMSEREFLKKVQRMGRLRFHEGEIRLPEALSLTTFRHAKNAYQEMGHMVQIKIGRDTLCQRARNDDADPSRSDALKDMARNLSRCFSR